MLLPEDKANLLAITWTEKQMLPPAGEHVFPLSETNGTLLDDAVLRSRWALKHLLHLDTSKATGPDALSARILKTVAHEIFMVIAILCRRILTEGRWPKTWSVHNLVPIYKRDSVFDANHYRGVHITSILSKVAERVIGTPLLHMFESHNCFGKHQWAYRKHRSSKDLITLLTCAWIFAFCTGKCIGAFLSDISGAFDKVFTPYFLSKFRDSGLGSTYLRFLKSYLAPRTGNVCVGGKKSFDFVLADQVFQGTVLGPPLWNVFFKDVVTSIVDPMRAKSFADDLNAFEIFDRNCASDEIMSKLRVCQSRIHEWGRKNRVSFDPAKEAFVILHPRHGVGATFKLLGLMVDTRLSMEEAVHAILQKARPKMRALLRTRGHYSVKDMFVQYKTHILGLLEANPGGIYHATTLGPIDRLQ